MTEALLMFAARRDNVERSIKPALAAKKWVICDRFTDSTYAYQGAGHGLARETIRRMESLVLDDFRPDLTLILDLRWSRAWRAPGAAPRTCAFEAFDRRSTTACASATSRSRGAIRSAAL